MSRYLVNLLASIMFLAAISFTATLLFGRTSVFARHTKAQEVWRLRLQQQNLEHENKVMSRRVGLLRSALPDRDLLEVEAVRSLNLIPAGFFMVAK